MKLTTFNKKIGKFKTNKRGTYSAIIFAFLFTISIFAEFIANDKPIFLMFENKFYFPVVEKLPETFLVESLKPSQIIKIHLYKI